MKKRIFSKFQTNNEHEEESKDKVNFRPPLPIGPPPQDILPILEIKKEIFDEGYQSLADSSPETDSAVYDDKMKIKKEDSDPRPMCKRFVRGSCTKGSSCSYKHEIDLAQLKTLFNFCWDYQNKTCDRPICKHVHASIFEEQNFYRTGYLPPKAWAHLQDNPDPTQDNNNAQLTVWRSPEYSDKLSNDLKLPKDQLLSRSPPKPQCLAPSGMKLAHPDMKTEIKFDTKSSKRSWIPNEELCSGHPASFAEPLSKKCKQCDLNSLRLQMKSNRLEEAMRSVVRMKESVEEVDAKTNRLKYIIKGFLALQDDKSLKDFINKVVSGRLTITEEMALEITGAVDVVLNLKKAFKP